MLKCRRRYDKNAHIKPLNILCIHFEKKLQFKNPTSSSSKIIIEQCKYKFKEPFCQNKKPPTLHKTTLTSSLQVIKTPEKG